MGFELPSQEPIVGAKKNPDSTYDYSKSAQMVESLDEKPVNEKETKGHEDEIRKKIVAELSESEQKAIEMKIDQSGAWRSIVVMVTNNLEHIGFKEWGELDALLEKTKMTPDQEVAVEYTIGVLNSLKQLKDTDSLLKRSSNRIADVVRALEVFKKINPEGGTDCSRITTATRCLGDAMGYLADEAGLHEVSLVISGKSEEEYQKALKESREKIKRMNVS